MAGKRQSRQFDDHHMNTYLQSDSHTFPPAVFSSADVENRSALVTGSFFSPAELHGPAAAVRPESRRHEATLGGIKKRGRGERGGGIKQSHFTGTRDDVQGSLGTTVGPPPGESFPPLDVMAEMLNPPGLLTMPRSPTSSEDEMAQSFSDYSDDCASDSSREETIYETIRATAEPSQHRMDDIHTNSLVIRVLIPDLQHTKCMRFNPDATVWVAKQRILCTLNQSLKDVLNYGLFQPASNGRDGKFLDEERIFREYPQPISKGVPSLEFRYKSRVYRQPNVDEKQIAKLHTKANLRKFMDLIQHNQVDKVSKLLERGFDPNYHDSETGECPLTFAAHLDGVVEMIKVLRNGGAHLDFRAKDGMTALHKAARSKNHVTLTTLLELGASPDYKDSRGLTPLYHSVVVGGDPGCCELLLNHHASVCCQDENGWHEVHQACRHGHVQHLEHLLFYGANMSAQNASGNTALHICALYNQDNCARVLLVRGADKEVKNYNSQSPFQVAIIAGNFELAELIKNHKETDIGYISNPPHGLILPK
ncbi:SH3 and multiple ankyrin repeat domains protein 3-like [Seriola lalandi dorsalis]|uniref:SH3 and multiple ankyrin repeat domains protein 3-like n=1 Tax=Seriola lalandi dorsalis TaxID=1841481 RepID=UPI000C6FC558|nr:SH3 and multiple ankyrin repeat domains protein 3-like [Seriola lalandi dorsalis]